MGKMPSNKLALAWRDKHLFFHALRAKRRIMNHFVVSSSLKRLERLEHLERLEPAELAVVLS